MARTAGVKDRIDAQRVPCRQHKSALRVSQDDRKNPFDPRQEEFAEAPVGAQNQIGIALTAWTPACSSELRTLKKGAIESKVTGLIRLAGWSRSSR